MILYMTPFAGQFTVMVDILRFYPEQKALRLNSNEISIVGQKLPLQDSFPTD